MKIYTHKGPGVYLGSNIIVCAAGEEEARDLIRKVLDGTGLTDEEVNEIEETEIMTGAVIYVDNGDY